MTNEQARSELMQIYGMLSEEKKQALDVLMAQADGDLISRQAVLDTLWFEPTFFDPLNVLTEARDRVMELPSVVIPSAYKGMTNGEVMHKLFPKDYFVIGEYGFDEKWWNSPYKGEQE